LRYSENKRGDKPLFFVEGTRLLINMEGTPPLRGVPYPTF